MMNQPFFIRQSGYLKKLNLEEILFIEAADNYIKFVAWEYSYTVRMSMDAALAQLPANMFIRTNRSYAVSLKHLDTIRKEYVTIENFQFPVSKKHYAEFIKQLNILESAIPDTDDKTKDPEPTGPGLSKS